MLVQSSAKIRLSFSMSTATIASPHVLFDLLERRDDGRIVPLRLS